MSDRFGSSSQVTPSTCEHLLSGVENQPLSLLAFPACGVYGYYCPTCLAAEVEMIVDHLPPAEIGAAISFAKCDHIEGHCATCEIAGTAAIQQSWARAALTDRARANRLGRLLRTLGKLYGRERPCIGAEKSASPIATAYSRQMLSAASLNGDRARAALRWEQDKVRRQRTLTRPTQTLRVIPPSRAAASA